MPGSEKDSLYLLALKLSGYTDTFIRRATEITGSAGEAWKNRNSLSGSLNFPPPARVLSPEDCQTLLEKKGQKFVSLYDPEYPALLKEIPLPPTGLFYQGELPSQEAFLFAIVGTRLPTAYGRDIARRFSQELVEAGCEIVSGMARGIDKEAHTGALEAKGKTYAVLGSGLDVIYPPEHKLLFEKIRDSGGVLSEYPPDTQPDYYNFPARNRIISGLCRGVLIVEAPEKSGALTTARSALDQGREVFAIPGRIDSRQSRGTHHLIRDGQAKLVTSVEDILTEFGLDFAIQKKKEAVSLTSEESAILALLTDAPRQVEELAQSLGQSIGIVMGQLTLLELKGLVRKEPGVGYTKTADR